MARRSRFPIPPNVCASCWLEGKVTPASLAFVCGFPADNPGPPMLYCPACEYDCHDSGWHLIPVSPTAEVDAALSRMEGTARLAALHPEMGPALPHEPSADDVRFNASNPPTPLDL